VQRLIDISPGRRSQVIDVVGRHSLFKFTSLNGRQTERAEHVGWATHGRPQHSQRIGPLRIDIKGEEVSKCPLRLCRDVEDLSLDVGSFELTQLPIRLVEPTEDHRVQPTAQSSSGGVCQIINDERVVAIGGWRLLHSAHSGAKSEPYTAGMYRRNIDTRVDRRGPRRLRPWQAVATVAIVLSACSSDESTVTPTTLSPVVATTLAPTPSDGVFRVGVLLPASGEGATIGAPLLAGVEVALDEINASTGGVAGVETRIQIEDEGADPADGMQQLVDAKVDVIVGPASSNVAASVLSLAVDAGIPVCSPTATAISLTQFPDQGLFFRTIPSDGLQVGALAALIGNTGLPSATAIVPDDEFGQRYVEQLGADLLAGGVTLAEVVTYDPASSDLEPEAAAAIATEPGVMVVVGDLVNGGRMLAALTSATDDLPPIFVNESLRSHDVVDALVPGSTSLLSKITGAAPASQPLDTPAGRQFASRFARSQPDASIEFAAYAYDCVVSFALASEASGSDNSSAIAATVAQITRDGQPCIGFKDCRELLQAGRNIDLEGASGPLELDGSGDVGVADLEVFGFDRDGEEVVVDVIRAG
jgi:branched-chain amino acid transport system substrate-binding protein